MSLIFYYFRHIIQDCKGGGGHEEGGWGAGEVGEREHEPEEQSWLMEKKEIFNEFWV